MDEYATILWAMGKQFAKCWKRAPIFHLPFTLSDELCINTIKYTKYYPREEYRTITFDWDY